MYFRMTAPLMHTRMMYIVVGRTCSPRRGCRTLGFTIFVQHLRADSAHAGCQHSRSHNCSDIPVAESSPYTQNLLMKGDVTL